MSERIKAFSITQGKGFAITFPNGHCVSVQFGPGNYCDNYHCSFSEEGQRAAGESGSMTAETAHIGPDGKFIDHEGDQVQARRTPEQVLALMNLAASAKGAA